MLPALRRTGLALSATAVTTAVAATLLAGCSQPQGMTPAAPTTSIITSTTKIAGAGVLGNQRRPDESCAAEPARTGPGDGADPQRIVALGTADLDALCALGLQSRVVGATTQPSYLGTVLHDVPVLGDDTAGIEAARPDLIVGPDSAANLGAIAPTVDTGAGGADWRKTLRAVGTATGRESAAADLVAEFADQARQTGVAADADHYQASVVQLTENAVRVYGTDNFPGSVLAAVGVDRPAAQRFTDHPFIEIASGDSDLADADFSAADGDIVYVSFESAAAKARAEKVFTSDAWRRLSANRDNRVFAVNNEVWQTGGGLVAARAVLEDLRWLNAPIN